MRARACVRLHARQHSDECGISAHSQHHYSSSQHGPRALESNPLHLILDFSPLQPKAMWTRLLHIWPVSHSIAAQKALQDWGGGEPRPQSVILGWMCVWGGHFIHLNFLWLINYCNHGSRKAPCLLIQGSRHLAARLHGRHVKRRTSTTLDTTQLRGFFLSQIIGS